MHRSLHGCTKSIKRDVSRISFAVTEQLDSSGRRPSNGTLPARGGLLLHVVKRGINGSRKILPVRNGLKGAGDPTGLVRSVGNRRWVRHPRGRRALLSHLSVVRRLLVAISALWADLHPICAFRLALADVARRRRREDPRPQRPL